MSNAMFLCYAIHMPERCCSASLLHVLHAAYYLLPLCASAAQVQLVVLHNHWVRAALLHLACAAPQAAPLAELGLAWVEEFKLSLSLCLGILGLGILGLGSLGTSNKCFHEKAHFTEFSKFTSLLMYFPP